MSKKHTLLAMLFAIIGFVFSQLFQNMFYWGGQSFSWFYVGVGLSYGCSILSVVFMVTSYQKNGLIGSDILFNLFSSLLVGTSIFWTTFIVIAWQG